MKKILLFLAVAVSALMAAGCKDKNEEVPVDDKTRIVGEWHCVPQDIDADIYVCFNANGTFDLYQKIGDGRHRKYSGNYTMEGNRLSGTYSDGSAWGSGYDVAFNGDNAMTLTASDGSGEARDYSRESVPSEVKAEAVEVRSADRMLNSQPQYRWL